MGSNCSSQCSKRIETENLHTNISNASLHCKDLGVTLEEQMIIKIQSIYRGYRVRKQYKKESKPERTSDHKCSKGSHSTKDFIVEKNSPAKSKGLQIKIHKQGSDQNGQMSSRDYNEYFSYSPLFEIESRKQIERELQKCKSDENGSSKAQNQRMFPSQLPRAQPDIQVPDSANLKRGSHPHLHLPSLSTSIQMRKRLSIQHQMMPSTVPQLDLCFTPADQMYIKMEDIKKTMLITMIDKSTYQGQWLGGRAHGVGKYIFIDGSNYSGDCHQRNSQWVCGKSYGNGIYTHSNGDTFQGEWVNNSIIGQGIYQYSQGVIYQGSWGNNHPNGVGRETYPKGGYYEGLFKNGQKHGEGILVFPNDQVYQGQFYLDQMQGQGLYIWPNQKKYDGSWKNSMMDGQGVMQWSDGTKYTGEYKMDKKDGYGVLKCADGSQYSGHWQNGQQHGEGEFTNSEGVTKRGLWKKGNLTKSNKIALIKEDLNN